MTSGTPAAGPQPSVSVVVAAYNAEAFIAEALDSVFAQTLRPLDVIVVDDGSSDRTGEIVRSYRFTEGRARFYRDAVGALCPEDVGVRWDDAGGPAPAIVYRRQENRGPARARNEGIRLARGEAVAFLDADDMWLPRALEILAAGMVVDKEIAAVFGDGLNFDAEAGAGCTGFSQQEGVCIGLIEQPFAHLIRVNRILTGAVLVRRAVLEELGGFDDSLWFGEDHELWLRIGVSYPFYCDGRVVLLRRRHKNSLSAHQQAFYEGRIAVLRGLKAKFGKQIAALGVDMGQEIRCAWRRLAYFHYLQGRRLKALGVLGRSWLPAWTRTVPGGRERGRADA